MLTLYSMDHATLCQKQADAALASLPPETVWLDLLNPTPEESRQVEKLAGAPIPSHDEMQEIESSSRLYVEDKAVVMTLPVLNKTTSAMPETTAITFILAGRRLVTVRYADPTPFGLFVHRLNHQPVLMDSGKKMMLGLLDQIGDRLADILEGAITEMDALSHLIFHTHDAIDESPDFKDVLRRVGRVGDLATRAKDSLLGLNRLILFFAAHADVSRDEKTRVDILLHDVSSIDDHAKFLSERVGFLLNATLGMVNIDQNNIIKIFSVVAVAFLPPTLIASIYGMNFEIMPELKWALGYPFVILLMILSATLPFYYFRRKRWL